MNWPETFNYVELPARSVPRAAAFYELAFGWRFAEPASDASEPSPLGRRAADDVRYLRGSAPGELVPEIGLVRVDAMPTSPTIRVAVGVDDIRAAIERITAAGGGGEHETEVIDDVHTAVAADSEGNLLGLWSPGPNAVDFWWRPHAGARVVDGTTVLYVELDALDLDRVTAFYSGLFGWIFAPPHHSHQPGGPVPSAGRALYGTDVVRYCTTARPEVGFVRADRVTPSDGVRVAVGVDDLDAALRRIERAGGQVVSPPAPAGHLTAATIADSEGNEVVVTAPRPGVRVQWTPHPMRAIRDVASA